MPRIRRCSAVGEELASFFDRWTATLGAAVIDPAPLGDDLAPTGPPDRVFEDEARRRMTILSDGTVPVSEQEPDGPRITASAAEEPLAELWQALLEARGRLAQRHGARSLVGLP